MLYHLNLNGDQYFNLKLFIAVCIGFYVTHAGHAEFKNELSKYDQARGKSCFRSANQFLLNLSNKITISDVSCLSD